MSPASLTGSYTEDELQFKLNEKAKFGGGTVMRLPYLLYGSDFFPLDELSMT